MKTTEAKFVLAMKLLQELAAARHPKSAADLARLTGIPKKSVHRYLDGLDRAGFPITFEKRGQTHFYSLLKEGAGVLPVGVSLEEATALAVGRAALEAAFASPFPAALHTLYKKIEASLPPDAQKIARACAGVFVASRRRAKDYRPHRKTLETAVRATAERRELRICYRAFLRDGKPSDAVVRPYALLPGEGGLYLLAARPPHHNPARYAIERIERAEMLDSAFAPPKINWKEQLLVPFGVYMGKPLDVKIRFAADEAPYLLEREWHPTQRITRERDGSLVVAFRASGLDEIRRWVLAYGAAAEVLAPKELRKAVARDLAGAAERYR